LTSEPCGLSPRGQAVTERAFGQTREGFGGCGKAFRLPVDPFAESPAGQDVWRELLDGSAEPIGLSPEPIGGFLKPIGGPP
jgi:hypothetical protein